MSVNVSIDVLLDRMFTNGAGEVAERLVLEGHGGRNLGGWGRGPLRDQIEDLVASALFVGQRVRMTDRARETFPRGKSLTGTVVRIGPANLILVKRDGYRSRPSRWGRSWWEPIPLESLPRDDVSDMLVAAYRAGEREAALALADHLMELHGGTSRESK